MSDSQVHLDGVISTAKRELKTLGVKFKPEFKGELLEALRSGDYKQHQGRLRFGDGFCCLGVSCDILNEEGWEKGEIGAGYCFSEDDHPKSITFPPKPIVAKMFERRVDGSRYYEQVMSRLVKMNDSGASFEQIADVIEEML